MMNDLEICKRIAEIEDVYVFEYNHIVHGNVICYDPVVNGLAPQQYNPFDDALFLHLLEYYGDKLYTEHDIEGDGNKTKWSIDPEHFEDNKFIYNRRSVLLAIIEAHNE